MTDEAHQGDWQSSELRPWTVGRVLDELPALDWYRQNKALAELAPQVDALAAGLERALPGLEGLARCNAAALLLRLQKRAGRDAFLAALASGDPVESRAALDLLVTGLIPEDSGYVEIHPLGSKVPVSCADIFAAISRRLAAPQSPEADTALFVCLKHDIAESRPLRYSLLESASGSQRLLVASWYLRNGRDDGAIDVLEALLAAAPEDPGAKDPSWYNLRGSWCALADFCRRAPKPLAKRAANLAMRVVASALDASDWRRRFEINDGFIHASCAAEVIASAMPEGGKHLLRRLVSTPINDYHRGRALDALCKAIGEASRDIVLASLGDPAIRQAAAASCRTLAEAGVSAGVLESLTGALHGEKRPEVVGAILSAMTALGEDTRPLVEAALERADPWERMRLNWQLQGGNVRAFAELLVDAGVADPIDDAALADASQGSLDLFSLLWAGGKRLAQIDIKCVETPPPHHQLFRDLLAIARPAVDVDRLSQRHDDNYRRETVPGMPGVTRETDFGTTCVVEFLHEGHQHSFRAYPSGRWLDVASVIAGFNSLMAQIGRDDRCYQFLIDGSHQFFAVAPEAKFRPLAERLRIPLQLNPDEPRQRGIEYVRRVTSQIR